MKFSIGTILTVTHSIMLTTMPELYDIFNYMLDDNLFTHQLPRASRFCEPFIDAQYPQIKREWVYSDEINENNWKEYLEKAEKMFGKELEINKVPSGVWTYKDPIEEMKEMVPKDKIIIVNQDKPNFSLN
jgi:L-fucose isomerase-like protein